MKTIKNLLSLIILFFLTLQVVVAQKVLTYSDHQSEDEMRTKYLKHFFFPAIEKESNGRLKIEAHWDGELAISYDAFNAVSEGKVADMATVVPEYSVEELPLHQIFKSFPVGPTSDKQVSFFRNAYSDIPEFSAELENNNLVNVFLNTGYGVGFYSRKPISLIGEIKGTKWRTASFWQRDFLSNYGATPVAIPWGEEVYSALGNELLDGVMVNVDSGYNLKLYEQAPYVLASERLWLGHLYIVAMNKTTWDSLDKQDQEAIERAAETSYKYLGRVMTKSFKMQLRHLEKAGASCKILSDKELEDFEQGTNFKDIQIAWAKNQESKGVENASEVLKKVTALMNE